MSSISFPNDMNHPHAGDETESFYTGSFTEHSTSGFQINPLSSHPPRTPRTSLHHSITSPTFSSNANTTPSHHRHFSTGSVYQEKHEMDDLPGAFTEQTIQVDVEDMEIDEEEEATKSAERKITQEQVWREMLLSSNGRDKAFKLIQYTIRVGLVFHLRLISTRLLRRLQRPAWETSIVNRLTETASGLSKTRKCLLLFNWLAPLSAIYAQQSVPFSAEVASEKARKLQNPGFLHTFLHASPPVLLEFANGVADDIATWGRLGLLGKRISEPAERFADWCWFLSTLVGLVENGVERNMIEGLTAEVEGRLYTESMTGATAKSKPKMSKLDERELARLQKQDYWLQVSRVKLFMDLIFVSYELFHIKRAKTSVKAFTGLTAAILSSLKLYDKHKSAILKTLLASAPASSSS